MGYSKFDGNEEDIMRSLLKEKWNLDTSIVQETIESYPQQIKSLLKKKMIKKYPNSIEITQRGVSAITQQLKTGEYWVVPLKTKKFNLYPIARIPRSLSEYIK